MSVFTKFVLVLLIESANGLGTYYSLTECFGRYDAKVLARNVQCPLEDPNPSPNHKNEYTTVGACNAVDKDYNIVHEYPIVLVDWKDVKYRCTCDRKPISNQVKTCSSKDDVDECLAKYDAKVVARAELCRANDPDSMADYLSEYVTVGNCQLVEEGVSASDYTFPEVLHKSEGRSWKCTCDLKEKAGDLQKCLVQEHGSLVACQEAKPTEDIYYLRRVVKLDASDDKTYVFPDVKFEFDDLNWSGNCLSLANHSVAEGQHPEEEVIGEQGDFGTIGHATKYWACCKVSCSWPNNANYSEEPVHSCGKDGEPIESFTEKSGGCSPNGTAHHCNAHQPWAVTDKLSYGFAATHIGTMSKYDTCCSCYAIKFTSSEVLGKYMVVQSTNTGGNLGLDHFDLQVPGGKDIVGCPVQWGDLWYHGATTKAECDFLPSPIRRGCHWKHDFLNGKGNPDIEFKRVKCPSVLTDVTGCKRSDDDQYSEFVMP